MKLPMLDTGYWMKLPMLDTGSNSRCWNDFIQNPVSFFVFIQDQETSIQHHFERRYDSCSIRIVVMPLRKEKPAIRPNKIGEIIPRHSGIF